MKNSLIPYFVQFLKQLSSLATVAHSPAHFFTSKFLLFNNSSLQKCQRLQRNDDRLTQMTFRPKNMKDIESPISLEKLIFPNYNSSGLKTVSNHTCILLLQYFEQLSPACPSNSGDFQHLQQQLIKVQAIMRRYEIHLSIGNLREYNHQTSSANYYLCVQNELREREYSFCQNIILTEGVFTFEVPSQIKLLQIWNYDKRKKVATVMLKREKETCFFSYQFKNFNLRLIIKSFNLLLDRHELRMSKKESLRTDESQNEHNISDECQV